LLERDRFADIEARIASLTQELDQLRAQLRGGWAEVDAAPHTHSRRGLLKLAGAAVAGAAGAAALKVVPAAAADGGNMLLGSTNDANATTVLKPTTTGTTPMLEVLGPGVSALPGSPPEPFAGAVIGVGSSGNDGVDGYAPGTSGAGVVGQSDSGYGVIGATASGIDLAALGGSGRIAQNPLAAPGPPGFAPTSGLAEMVRDSGRRIWASNADGASWRPLNSLILITPVRVVDTRPGAGGSGPLGAIGPILGPLTGHAHYDWALQGTNGIPAAAVGIVGNITAVNWTAGIVQSGGDVRIYPYDGTNGPTVSTLNFGGSAQSSIANHFVAAFGSGGKVSVYTDFNPGDSVHIIIDVSGYIE